MINVKLIRDHATKEAMETVQIEMYIFICKLLMEELAKLNRKDQTSF